MARRLLQAFAILACLYSGSAGSQAPQGSPVPKQYSLEGTSRHQLGSANLSEALGIVDQPEPALRLRGAREIELYRTLAPSVALIVTDTGSGSGSLIAINTSGSAKSGILLTNAHVVGDATEVAVVFKPQKEGEKIGPANAVPGLVRKVDPVRDLALVEVMGVPANAVVISLGAMTVAQVGADVHAIGHPAGQTWTYTKGLISQIRPGYEWQIHPSTKHVADVIQTQTPINPGNSGGPLISDGGRLIGVNSFKAGGEGLNFAVSVGEVQKFLTAAQGGAYEPKPPSAAPKPCEARILSEGRAPEKNASIANVDLNCSGRVNAILYFPDDKSKPVVFNIDTNNDGKPDAWIFDEDRDEKWDYSLWDTDFDGKPDLIGYHPDGKLEPSRFEKYRPKP